MEKDEPHLDNDEDKDIRDLITDIGEEETKKIDKQYEIDKEKRGPLVTYKKSIGVSLLLTILIPPFGQFYNGQILKGILFMLISFILGLISGIFSLIFWIFMMYDAYKNSKLINKNNGNYFFNENIKTKEI
ncbi:hypothetical protein [Methanobrevibacter sp. DSM 116169]|uniref:hypothetical protein n=1 Tax=Methanobrevibacter sp. DSM 116169 TaxID=3242727 RepID=UPI0038FC6E50